MIPLSVGVLINRNSAQCRLSFCNHSTSPPPFVGVLHQQTISRFVLQLNHLHLPKNPNFSSTAIPFNMQLT